MQRRHERKVVTILFCDLVGFTSRAEEMDPEDVAALLGPYQARLKEDLERYGGTVEKFIGDAVMAVFGAPVAHEDDPERAVRAALAICEYAEAQNVELRIGIATGEALVDVDARPEAGETMATGDVVNTAARLQAAAPVNGILVSEATRAATEDAVVYERTKPVEAKGKARPVPTWRALEASPVAQRAHTTPLVGRERELELLAAALARAREEEAPQLLTLVGAPGIGKSRLVHELARVEGGFLWRKGRCLPYGEGVTFWALGEIVKGQLAILENDDPAEADGKLRAGVDNPWVADHLRSLVGLGDPRGAGSDRRAEAFAAWREFLAGLAAQQPLALVLEDLHWADDALLDFVTQLFDWARESPLVLLCTARPELLERRPGWGANRPRTLTVALDPLSDDDTATLFTGLAGGAAGEELLARAGGNPLYAEQYARLVAEGGALDELPATVHGIIAARLDGLPAHEKALVQDAAVIGRVFWSGAVAAGSSGDRWSVEERLLELERRDLVRREQRSSVEGETQYAFRHILLRDVAYGAIPRALRGEKHRLAAEWIEALGRPEDHAEMRANHYVQALELARVAGKETYALEEPARRALRDAGNRAMALHAYGAAARFYERALELWPEKDRERPMLLFRRARAVSMGIDAARLDFLEQARDALSAAGDRETAAEAEMFAALALRFGGRPLDALDRARSAADLLEDAPSSRAKALVVANLARLLAVTTGQAEEATEVGRESLAIAEELGLDELKAHALNTLGIARVKAGDHGGIDVLEASLRLALEHGSPFEIGRIQNNLAYGYFSVGRIDECVAALEARLEMAQRIGVSAGWERSMLALFLWPAGRWQEAEALVYDVLGSDEMPLFHEPALRGLEAQFRLARDDVVGAAWRCEQALALGREREWQAELESEATLRELLVLRANIALAEGRRTAARELADEALGITSPEIAGAVELAVLHREVGLPGAALTDLASSVPPNLWWDVVGQVARGELEEAADRLEEIGARSHEALVRLRAAAELSSEGRRGEADAHLQKALAFYRSVGAARYVRVGEALLAATA